MAKITVDKTTTIEVEVGKFLRLVAVDGGGRVILEASETSHGLGEAEVQGKSVAFSLDVDQAKGLRDALSDWIGDKGVGR